MQPSAVQLNLNLEKGAIQKNKTLRKIKPIKMMKKTLNEYGIYYKAAEDVLKIIVANVENIQNN